MSSGATPLPAGRTELRSRRDRPVWIAPIAVLEPGAMAAMRAARVRVKRCRCKAGNVRAKTLRSRRCRKAFDLNGDGDVDSILDLVRGPPCGLRIPVEESRPMVKVEVDDGLNVHGHGNLNDGRQGQGPGQRPPDAGAPEGKAPAPCLALLIELLSIAGIEAVCRAMRRDPATRDCRAMGGYGALSQELMDIHARQSSS
jgi:hypothetical protein